MPKLILQDYIIKDIRYDELGPRKYNNLKSFSHKKQLFSYQKQALENFIKALYVYFEQLNGSKVRFFQKYVEHGLHQDAFSVCKPKEFSNNKNDKKINERFKLLSDFFHLENAECKPCIAGYNFINRMAFWMATGSGKSLVIIKAIEILDYLQNLNLIPKRNILLLLPRDDLIKQFEKQIQEFNQYSSKQILFLDLREFESQARLDFDNVIKVYYYRSDLIRTERGDKILDFRSFDNFGKWYLFLDEAHRGEKGDSVAQDIFSILTRDGFLFNFSATFVDEIDKITTAYNFNLEEFIKAGYGKNICLSESYFKFTKSKDDFTQAEKQKQVLKSLITFAWVKKIRINKNLYHSPLLITLVNSVNTEDADLLLFFKEIEKIATGRFDKALFETAKKELKEEILKYPYYILGDEKLDLNFTFPNGQTLRQILEGLSIEDLFEMVFNTQTVGKIEFLEGEKGKELAMKLESADRPFALIKIGDTNKFKKDQLGFEYNVIESFDTKRYFETLNERDDINLLIGSRSFYEGWDSNRPNVINMINIGKKEAEKFVLQGIGRGIRIQPGKYTDPEKSRKRLPFGDPDKNPLLETLFVYATDKKSVEAILKSLETQKSSTREVNIGNLFEKNKPVFDLLIPRYKEIKKENKESKFYLSEETYNKFKNYLENISPNVVLLKFGIKKSDFEKIKSKDFYKFVEDKKYYYDNFDYLLGKVIGYLKTKIKVVDKIDKLKDEIIHFKHIKVLLKTPDFDEGLTPEELEMLVEKIRKVKFDSSGLTKEELFKLVKEGKITPEKFGQMIEELQNSKNEEVFKDLKIKKILEHYYLPVVYSENEKQRYIKHIINTESEVKFLERLENLIEAKNIGLKWMFSKIDESLDSVYIPYFDFEHNDYRKFYPDFIFWITDGKKYKIVFVDPKGTKHSDYLAKIEGFEKLFLDRNGIPKMFKYKDFAIVFDLKLVTDDIRKVRGDRRYWMELGEIMEIFEIR